jgi:hypothetical protein
METATRRFPSCAAMATSLPTTPKMPKASIMRQSRLLIPPIRTPCRRLSPRRTLPFNNLYKPHPTLFIQILELSRRHSAGNTRPPIEHSILPQ